MKLTGRIICTSSSRWQWYRRQNRGRQCSRFLKIHSCFFFFCLLPIFLLHPSSCSLESQGSSRRRSRRTVKVYKIPTSHKTRFCEFLHGFRSLGTRLKSNHVQMKYWCSIAAQRVYFKLVNLEIKATMRYNLFPNSAVNVVWRNGFQESVCNLKGSFHQAVAVGTI